MAIASTSAPVPPKEQEQIKQFIRAVYDMTESRFMASVKAQDHTVKMERSEDGQYRLTAPEYDWDDFRSFLTTVRKIAISKDEPVYFPTIRNIIARYGGDQTRDELKMLKREISKTVIEGNFSQIQFRTETSKGARTFTSYELIDAITNGWVFHSDSIHADTIATLRSKKPWQFIWPILFEFIMPVVNASVLLVNIARAEGVLSEAEFPKRMEEV